jgi:3-dehydroquinate synthase
MANTTPSLLEVKLAERSYPIVFAGAVGPEIRREVEKLTQAGRRVAVITDANVARAQPQLFDSFGEAARFEVAPGEGAKSPEVLAGVWNFLAKERIDRTGALFVVGGGVVGDLGGFAAASWLRGIEFYQVPTTLLAMVDSSVGGKTGINIPAGKNLVGAFHQPRAVFIGTDLLATLPPREFAAGMGEVIKYGLLADPRLFAALEQSPLTLNSPDLAAVIRRCCELKAGVVQADERELAKEGGRALLNLGHTFGHAIEQVTGYGAYLHGEAVAIGLCAAARLSEKLGTIAAADVARVDAVVAAHQLPTRLRASLALENLLAAMARDKKVRAGLPRFVVLKSLGEAITQDGAPSALVEACFREVGAR